MKWIKFNLNDTVKVKLTEEGKKILIKKWGTFPSWWEKDENGFSTIQCHEFMETFGSEMHMSNTAKLPTETNIYLKGGQ